MNLQVCPAGERCLNQAFTKRQYSQVEIFRTLSRGWGLRCVHDIKKVKHIIVISDGAATANETGTIASASTGAEPSGELHQNE